MNGWIEAIEGFAVLILHPKFSSFSSLAIFVYVEASKLERLFKCIYIGEATEPTISNQVTYTCY